MDIDGNSIDNPSNQFDDLKRLSNWYRDHIRMCDDLLKNPELSTEEKEEIQERLTAFRFDKEMNRFRGFEELQNGTIVMES